MKFQIEKKLRLALIILVAALFAAAAFFLVRALARPGVVEQKVPLYTYSQQARVNYRVYLKPNSLYPEAALDAGNVYITNFVEKINTDFTYKFSGERAAEVKGEYDVVAVVEATAGKDNKKVWQREFVLLPRTGFAGKDQVVSVQREIQLGLPDYLNFVSKVVKDSELTPEEVNLTVRWNVEVEAATDSGPVKENIASSMVIPISHKAFEVGGELTKEKPGAINTVRQLPAKVDRKFVAASGTAAGLCAVVLLLLLLFTSGSAAETDPLQRKINQLLKKHGDRLAVIDGELPGTFENVIPVKSVDDLVRIADELSKPVMYKPFSGHGEIPAFYVFDEPKIFIFELKV